MRDVHIAQSQSQSLGRSTSTLKLTQIQLRHIKTPLRQSLTKIRLHRTHHNIPSGIDHIAAKLRRLQLTDNNTLIRHHKPLQSSPVTPRQTPPGNTANTHHSVAQNKDQDDKTADPQDAMTSQTYARHPPHAVAVLARANPMRSPQMPAIRVKKRIAFPFKRSLPRRRPCRKPHPPTTYAHASLPSAVADE